MAPPVDEKRKPTSCCKLAACNLRSGSDGDKNSLSGPAEGGIDSLSLVIADPGWRTEYTCNTSSIQQGNTFCNADRCKVSTLSLSKP